KDLPQHPGLPFQRGGNIPIHVGERLPRVDQGLGREHGGLGDVAHEPTSSRFLTLSSYVTTGKVFSSASTWYPRGRFISSDTRLFGLLISPNVIACVGQDCMHAVSMSPSWTGTPSAFARSLPSRMRWMQNVHFSITPLDRTVTSGLSTSLSDFSRTLE